MQNEAEKLLRFIVDKAKKTKVSTIAFNASEIEEFSDINNTDLNELLDELELGGMLSNYILDPDGNVEAYLTSIAMKYFLEEKKPAARQDRNEKKKPAARQDRNEKKEPAARQDRNGEKEPDVRQDRNEEMKKIASSIKKQLTGMDKLDAEVIADILVLAGDELKRDKPRGSRLMNCLTLIAATIQTVEKNPKLEEELQYLGNYIALYID